MKHLDKGDLVGAKKAKKLPSPGRQMSVWMRDGDMETVEWLCEQLGMTKADVFKRAIHVFAAQVVVINKMK